MARGRPVVYDVEVEISVVVVVTPRGAPAVPVARERGSLDLGEDTVVVMEGKRRLMLGSNNYLGLTHHPEVLEAAATALRRYGSGCTGSRFLNGTIDLLSHKTDH